MKSKNRIVTIAAVLILLLAVVLTLALRADAKRKTPRIEAGIAEINKYGNVILTIGPESMTALGYEPGDIVSVEIGGAELRMPIGTSYSDVDSGEPVCCYKSSTTGTKVVVQALAASYLEGCGMSLDELAQLKARLGADHGGLN